jgi:hypothetical protein
MNAQAMEQKWLEIQRLQKAVNFWRTLDGILMLAFVFIVFMSAVAFGIHMENYEKRLLSRVKEFEWDMKELVYPTVDMTKTVSNLINDRNWIAEQTLRHEALMEFYEKNQITERKEERLQHQLKRLTEWEKYLQHREDQLQRSEGAVQK